MLISKTKQTKQGRERKKGNVRMYIVRIRSTNYIESAKKKKTT